MTTLTKLFGIEVPVIQAPMAGVGTPQLAAAVSNAGALGSLAVGAMNAEQARDAIRETCTLTARPFNVNLFCHTPTISNLQVEADWLAYLAPHFERFGAKPPSTLSEIYGTFQHDEAMLEMLLEERPAIVSFHFGLPPQRTIRRLKEAGIVLIASVTNVEEARLVEAAGLDAIVAQGYEAGGHRGAFDPEAPDEKLGTLALTRLLVSTTSLPVISAGGIMDGAGVAAVLVLGAGAAQLGTAFIACPESQATAAHRAALVSPKVQTTAMTSAISGRPARGIVNGFTTLDAAPQHPIIPPYPYAYAAGRALAAAAKAHQNTEFAVQWAGQAARLSRPMPAADLVALLREEIAAQQEALRGRAEQ